MSTAPTRSWLLAVTMTLAALGAANCNRGFDELSSEQCRFEPHRCDGGAGATCRDDRDCAPEAFCCESDNCGGGMCTVECRGDGDCPPDMLCEHRMCFYACASDRDCAPEMSCEHGNTVCEYD